MNNDPRYLVLAGSYREFDYFCRMVLNVGVRHAETAGFRFIADSQSLRGFRNPYVIRYGSYRNRDDYHLIMMDIRYCDAIAVEDYYDEKP